ncbi:Ras suppressor protein (contains leucine-rich repeats) [Handroanthus impetiginosus]|uniref:Ras suppressor protein (Contains leucine-rich repeats) n=1 Tax=Handroanthus impetiginosus TaxID=429701 RepID=A0A2G9HV14_9LAMI|nr:Ras suppressor protein (contains leucine-rich repeats) [Handroanthus impetiginosus]
MSSSSLQLLLITLTTSLLLSNATNDHPNKNLPSSMDRIELETLFKIMETLSSDQDWRVSYPNPCQPGSSWPGIECKYTPMDNHFHVTRLDFGTPPNPSCKNTAKFPSEIFQLPHLESIFVFQCFTEAPTRISVPPNKPLMSRLQQLSFRSNSALIGTIPPQISSLKSLQILTLSQNKLTGEIPVEIFSLSSLVHLDLSYNLLSGAIPLEVGNVRSLVGLDLSYNRLMGQIPSAIGELRILQKLDLSSNSLTGSVPESIQHLQSLVFLALSNNNLRGSFPRGLTGLQNLQYFLMDDNPMFVPLPEELGRLKKLQELRLANSGYSGTIPPSYSQLTNLSTLSLQNNRLSGQIPVGLANLSHIYHLNLSRNFLDGVVPFNSSFLKRLGKNLDLSGNLRLCLSPSAGNSVNVGVGVCGSSKTSSLITPVRKSEAPLKCSILFIVNIALVILTLVYTSFCG